MTTTEKFRILKDSSIYNNDKASNYGDDVLLIDVMGGIYLGNNTRYPTRIAIANLDTGGSSGGGGNTEVSTKGGTVLYEVTTSNANFSDVTLSQSSSNFTQLDICCCTDVGETIFTSVYNPNGNIFNVSSLIQESGELIIKSKQYEINGSNITTVQGLGGMLSVSSEGIATVDGNYIGIYKVIGY